MRADSVQSNLIHKIKPGSWWTKCAFDPARFLAMDVVRHTTLALVGVCAGKWDGFTNQITVPARQPSRQQ
jgi:hypothetical protein